MPMSVDRLKIRLWNSRSGMTGSAARFSARTNSAQASTAPTASPTMTGSDQSYSVPPQLATRTVHETAVAISAMPR